MRLQALNSDCDLASKDEELAISGRIQSISRATKFLLQICPIGSRAS